MAYKEYGYYRGFSYDTLREVTMTQRQAQVQAEIDKRERAYSRAKSLLAERVFESELDRLSAEIRLAEFLAGE